ncbi:MAG TPA: recombinase family protein, partial [Paludibacter sp.]|nr:recombinase family protein [Paludibacter sp.]
MENINSYWGSECIILTRVSTQSQSFEGQNLDLKIYAKSLGFTNVTIISTKESGFKIFDNKEGFGLVLEHLKENPNCKTILVTELSRIGRNRLIITKIEYYLRENKINLIVKDTNLRLFDDKGKLNESSSIIFAIYASMAESEMTQKKERFSRAKRKFFSEGVSITGSVLFGYNRVLDTEINKNIYQINPEKAEQIKTIFQWYISGIDGDTSKSSISLITLECIKKGFDNYLHSKRNVNKCLKEEAYTGQKTTNNKMKNPEFWEYGNKTANRYINANQMIIKYPVILSNEVFKSVQMKLKERNSATDKSKHTTILSKMVVCPECNHYFRGEYLIKKGDIKHFYRCSHSKSIVNPCTNKSTISMLQLDSVIWSFVKQNVSELVDKINSFYLTVDITEIEQQIENLKSKILDYE